MRFLPFFFFCVVPRSTSFFRYFFKFIFPALFLFSEGSTPVRSIGSFPDRQTKKPIPRFRNEFLGL